MGQTSRLTVGLVAAVAIWGLAAAGGWASHAPLLSPEPPARDTAEIVVTEDKPGPNEVEISRESDEAQPVRLRTCELDDTLVSAADGELYLSVRTLDGQPLLSRAGDQTVAPASVVKLFTAVAAMRTLGPDFRFTTRVIAGDQPGEIWLVGGGDVTLTRSPQSNYYDSDASVESLATQAVQALAEEGLAPTGFSVDATRYEQFPQWNDSWRAGAARLGFVAPVTALQVDADRDQPAVRLSPRSGEPTVRASMWFGDALDRAAGTRVDYLGTGVAPDGSVIAAVSSAPLTELLRIMLVDSDNSLAEVIAREVALAQGMSDPGAAVLDAAGLPDRLLEDVVLVDGSGLSDDTQISQDAVTWLLADIAASDALDAVRDGLAIAGETGSLRNRYETTAGALAGRVAAKTGSLTGIRSLAGYIEADDGSEMVFSVVVAGPRVDNSSRADIDLLVADLARCGENLADWNSTDRDDSLG
mgnify:FL=1